LDRQDPLHVIVFHHFRRTEFFFSYLQWGGPKRQKIESWGNERPYGRSKKKKEKRREEKLKRTEHGSKGNEEVTSTEMGREGIHALRSSNVNQLSVPATRTHGLAKDL
jgi:hypothetical protein